VVNVRNCMLNKGSAAAKTITQFTVWKGDTDAWIACYYNCCYII
jgi:hypothetical protein